MKNDIKKFDRYISISLNTLLLLNANETLLLSFIKYHCKSNNHYTGQDYISKSLNITRQSTSKILHKLKDLGLITYKQAYDIKLRKWKKANITDLGDLVILGDYQTIRELMIKNNINYNNKKDDSLIILFNEVYNKIK